MPVAIGFAFNDAQGSPDRVEGLPLDCARDNLEGNRRVAGTGHPQL
jgi:hypothetical protein